MISEFSNIMKFNFFNKINIGEYLFCISIGIAFGLILSPAYDVVTGIVGGREIQTIESNSGHRAVLYKKHNLADINFKVGVDGETVYNTGDIMPFPDGMYRETLVWDKTGRVVVLELMGKRVFAYDAVEKRSLGKGELSSFKLYPISSDYVYTDLKDIDE